MSMCGIEILPPPLFQLSETKVFTASSVPAENHVTPGQR